ncbi:uncharacterized protein LOC119992750 [Tripterygium wilfordii]|uniref:uncharacterized protein LOC119992748 n=1 Tax=Tripterygium wilfordii TaxID=458696 RepID=UPI0018F85197|nr:uncharacterized protein LOC119992748 [Tripterygium wilfordii]XP_038695471.1 uncharacterized protein LOC119992750 [Tripterygium wilfordii]
MVVRAFDGTRREIMGEIEIPLEVANVTFNVPFVVMDISPTYSCLLGRPWIHTVRAIPSLLHQMLNLSNSSPIDAPMEGIESSFQSFEIANASYVKEGRSPLKP